MDFKGRDIISIKDFSREEILHILNVSDKIRDSDVLKGRVLATLFFEPSTRTRLSFEAAMQKLGGNVIGFADSNITSVKKGETLHDTVKVIGGYCDIIVIRHPDIGSAKIAADATDKPVINGGDGANQHPTQTFLDLYTIFKNKQTLSGLNVGFLGDLKYGRTVHSLAYALSLFNTNMFFISPKSLKMPREILRDLKGVNFQESQDVLEVSKELDVLYVTRIQKERFQFEADFKKVEGIYRFDKSFLNNCKDDIIIMHPLPRVGEIKHDLDDTKNAVYFQQAHNGIKVRQALLGLVLGAIE